MVLILDLLYEGNVTQELNPRRGAHDSWDQTVAHERQVFHCMSLKDSGALQRLKHFMKSICCP
jgi:hypothetical protein